MAAASDLASARVQAEWRARIAAEYTSAAITQHLTLWLIQAGAPPDLIDGGLAVVADELAHARLSQEVYAAAGGTALPEIDQAQLALPRTAATLASDIVRVAVRAFCLGETVAVPLFAHLRARCTQPVARAALDRIIRDEVRHRDLGWDLLDWQLAWGADPAAIAADLPAMLAQVDASYGRSNRAVADSIADRGPDDDRAITDADRAWGVAPPREYADILDRTIEREYRPRFAARAIVLPVSPPR